jgi:predicted nuclease of predicted toxin-antitoxin system
MKLLFDQNLSEYAAEILRSAGVDVLHASEVGLATAADSDILDWCRREQRTLFTHDGDFHALLALSGADRPSVIRIRVEGLKDRQLAELIERIVDQVRGDIQQGCTVSVMPASIRVRRLPLIRDE